MIEKIITNFGSIGIPVLLIWIQYTYNQVKEKERRKKEQESEYKEKQKEKKRALDSLKKGESTVEYGFSKIFSDMIQSVQEYINPEHQARENGATEEEISQAKRQSQQKVIESQIVKKDDQTEKDSSTKLF